MSDLPPPPEPPPPPPPPPGGTPAPPPPGYVAYGQHQPAGHGAYAGFWIRFAAALLDGILIGIAVGILGAVVGVEGNGANLLNLIAGVAYFGALEGGATGQTLGKKVCGLRVVDATTGQAGIGVGRAIGRYFARWLSAIPLLLGYLWMLWDDKKQTWHDKLVSSLVVKA
jgi:uncharacterized RDD family membrane protein YckC